MVDGSTFDIFFQDFYDFLDCSLSEVSEDGCKSSSFTVVAFSLSDGSLVVALFSSPSNKKMVVESHWKRLVLL